MPCPEHIGSGGPTIGTLAMGGLACAWPQTLRSAPCPYSALAGSLRHSNSPRAEVSHGSSLLGPGSKPLPLGPDLGSIPPRGLVFRLYFLVFQGRDTTTATIPRCSTLARSLRHTNQPRTIQQLPLAWAAAQLSGSHGELDYNSI
jgi:hypothetical protein